jgi:hypothetical protein
MDGFRHTADRRILYWRKSLPVQNFGDFLTELFVSRLFMYPRIDADVYRLIGSVITDDNIYQGLREMIHSTHGLVAFWGCGMRDGTPLKDKLRSRCSFLGVRGPLTRDSLGLPPDTVLCDPGLLVPLCYQPTPSRHDSGRSLCIPHFNDTRPDEELLSLSGCDAIVRPGIANSAAALCELVDKIASADFVLSAALHGAIVAAAFRRPFSFWTNGHVDLPFKWQDFAGSVGIACEFEPDLARGRARYFNEIAANIRLPRAVPMLLECPFVIRPSMMARAALLEGGAGEVGHSGPPLDTLSEQEASLIRQWHAASPDGRVKRRTLANRLVLAAGKSRAMVQALGRKP